MICAHYGKRWHFIKCAIHCLFYFFSTSKKKKTNSCESAPVLPYMFLFCTVPDHHIHNSRNKSPICQWQMCQMLQTYIEVMFTQNFHQPFFRREISPHTLVLIQVLLATGIWRLYEGAHDGNNRITSTDLSRAYAVSLATTAVQAEWKQEATLYLASCTYAAKAMGERERKAAFV